MIFVRYVWSNMTAKSAHFEQAFSTDGGKTWEVNWITIRRGSSEHWHGEMDAVAVAALWLHRS